MTLWQIFGVCSVAFFILEMFTPHLFFFNFALAALATSALSVYMKDPYVLTIVFVVLSIALLVFLRPILVKKFGDTEATGIDSKYIGQVVKVEEEITSNSGVITIYGERWEARSENNENIPAGSEVKIVRNESIIMYVEKI